MAPLTFLKQNGNLGKPTPQRASRTAAKTKKTRKDQILSNFTKPEKSPRSRLRRLTLDQPECHPPNSKSSELGTLGEMKSEPRQPQLSPRDNPSASRASAMPAIKVNGTMREVNSPAGRDVDQSSGGYDDKTDSAPS
jgi:hypothetical protein